MSALDLLASMGVRPALAGDAIMLHGLDSLEVDERRQALSIARKNKADLLAELRGAVAAMRGKAKLCPMCGNWRQRKGYAYWCGMCASSGREINFQSRCNIGMTELPRGRV